MDKQTVYVKSNGLRNELKEIRKSIDALTAVMVDMVDAIDIATAQTNKQYENNYSKHKHHNDDRLRKSKYNDD